MGLGNTVLDDLEHVGFLRCDFSTTLRNQYIPWLIQQSLQHTSVEDNNAVILEEVFDGIDKELRGKHKKALDKENQRRQQILDQREQERKVGEAIMFFSFKFI